MDECPKTPMTIIKSKIQWKFLCIGKRSKDEFGLNPHKVLFVLFKGDCSMI